MLLPIGQIIPTAIETFMGFKALFLHIKQNPLNHKIYSTHVNENSTSTTKTINPITTTNSTIEATIFFNVTSSVLKFKTKDSFKSVVLCTFLFPFFEFIQRSIM